MKTVMIDKPGKISITETPIPVQDKGEALLKIKYCGICGADVASYTGNQPFTTYPRIPGHEFSAEIADLPSDYKGELRIGELVTCNPYFNCGKCYSCRRGHLNCCADNKTMGVQRDGSFCEYITMPACRIYSGMGLDAKQLALIEPFSISWHAINLIEIKKDDRVLIIGAGPIGLFALISAKLKGAKVWAADILDGRLEMARQYGADGTINTKNRKFTEAAAEITNGDGFDVCVEACGLPETFLAAIDCAAFAANIILIGNGKKETTFLHSVLLKKELKVFGSRNSLEKDFRSLIQTVAEDKIDVMRMVSAIYPIERADEAFKALASNNGSLAKILIEVS